MAFTDITNIARIQGDGATLVYSFTFPVQQETDLVVNKIIIATEVATLQVLNTDYTVSLNTVTDGGTVTYTTAPLSTEDSHIKRTLALNQETDIPTESNFPEVAVENEFDRSRMIDIQLDEKVDRAIKFPETSSLSNKDAPEGTSADDRGTKIWGWSADGLELTLYNATIVDAVSVIASQGDIVQGDASGDAVKLTIGGTGAILHVSAGLLAYLAIGSNNDTLQIVAGQPAWVGNPTIASFVNSAHDHADAAGGGDISDSANIAGRWDLLQSQTASADATIDFTTGIGANYDTYKMIMEDVLPASDSQILLMRVSTSSSFNNSDYAWAEIKGVAVATATGAGDNDDSEMHVGNVSYGTAGNESCNGVLTIHNLAKALKTWFSGTTIGSDATPNTVAAAIGGRYKIAEVNDGIRFLFASGNIASGTFKLYGLRV